MKVAVLGSGSRGNAIAVRADGETLLIDAGFGPKAVAKRAGLLDMTLEPLCGIVLTHEHGDHARGAGRIARRFECPILGSPGTLAALAGQDDTTTQPLNAREATTVGPFTVEAAHSSHDASEPMVVAVTSPGGTKVGVAYDLGRPTTAVRYLLRGCSALVLEANHDDVLLRTGPYPPSVRQRIAGSGGHLSNRAAASLAAELHSERLEAVILVHVSERCNRPELARHEVSRALKGRGFRGEVFVAGQDVPCGPVQLAGEPQLMLSLPVSPRPR